MERAYSNLAEDADVLAEDNTRPSLPEDFPNFRDFQIEKMVLYFRVVTDGSEQRLRLGFKCKLCGEVFNKTMQLLGHIRNHFEENHSCKDCGKYFFDTNKLHIHKRAKHTQALQCQLGCPSYTTSNMKCLRSHYLRYHCIKMRPREMKKMEGTVNVSTGNLNKIRIERERVVDQQRSLPIVQQQQQVFITEDEEDVDDEDIEQYAEQPEDEFDDAEEFGQTVECCVCDVYIPSEEVLRSHEKTHTSPYSCKICSTAFEALEDARNHYAAHEKPQTLQNPVPVQTITVTPAAVGQQASISVATTSVPQPIVTTATPSVTTMLLMHNGTPILVPVQTFDSSQLVPAFTTQTTAQSAPFHSQPSTAATTITPITTAWPISQLLPVNNQIEIIPIHSAQPATAGTTGVTQTATLAPIGSAQTIPVQNVINVKHDLNSTVHPNGGIVITPITTLDQNYLRQQQALQMQLQQQQQQQQ